jgi:hypothetical protein
MRVLFFIVMTDSDNKCLRLGFKVSFMKFPSVRREYALYLPHKYVRGVYIHSHLIVDFLFVNYN